MPWDLVDAFVEIKELQEVVKNLITELQEKGVINKPKKESGV